MAQGLIDTASAVRAFVKVEKKTRGASDSAGSYRCETGEEAFWFSEYNHRAHPLFVQTRFGLSSVIQLGTASSSSG
jgi:hypothetical protein